MSLDKHLRRKWDAVPDELRAQLVARVREVLVPEDVARIRAAIAADPREWWVGYHMGFGMAIRNALRAVGLTDQLVGGNLDEYWVQAVEAAVQEDGDGRARAEARTD